MAEAHQIIETRRKKIAELEQRIAELLKITARQPQPWLRIVGAAAMIPIDMLTSSALARELGYASPECYLIGGSAATGLIALASYASMGAKVDGKKPAWWYFTLSSVGVVASSLTIIRAANASPTGDPLYVTIAQGVFSALGVVGPAGVFEHLIGQIRPGMPDVNELRSLRRQLRIAKKELKAAVQFLAVRTRQREIWEDWASTLTASYRRGFLISGGIIPVPGTPSNVSGRGSADDGAVDGTKNAVNGLFEWPR